MLRTTLAMICLLSLCACQSDALSCTEQLAMLAEQDVTALTQREYDGPADESTEGARIVHHYDGAQNLRRVTVTYFGERSRREIDYRLTDVMDVDTFAMTVSDVAYAQPISAAQPTRGGETTVANYQMCDGAVIVRPESTDASDDRDQYLERLAAFITPDN